MTAMHLSIDYPWYFVVFCLLLGAAYSVVLYVVKFRGKGVPYSKGVRLTLMAVRFVLVSVIAFLLLSPLVKRQVHEKERPLVIVAEDNSQSPMLCRDSLLYRTDYREAMNRMTAELGKDYEVVRYAYGADITLDPKRLDNRESATDMSLLLNELCQRYKGRNVGAIVLTGDGIYNRGANPLSVLPRIAAPIYTVALGDTTVRCDAALANTRHNREALLGSRFPVEVTVKAAKLKGKRATLTLTHKGKQLYSKELSYGNDHFATTETILVDADDAGVQSYRLALSVAEGEESAANNAVAITVNVIDSRRKVAIVAAAPHPDISALRRSLESNQSYDVSSFLARDINAQTLAGPKGYNLKECQLAILHQMPTSADQSLCRAIVSAGIPVIYIVGSQTDLSMFNSLQKGITISTNLKKSNEVTARGHRNFAPFTIDEYSYSTIERLPPLTAPFGDYKLGEGTQVMFSAMLGDIATDQPLLAVNSGSSTRTVYILGEGLWRWRMREQAEGDGESVFDQLMSQLVLYTTIEHHDKPLRVNAQPIYKEGEPITLTAELYNDNSQLSNTADVKLSLTPADGGEAKDYLFNRSGNGYKLTLGALPHGTYSYRATATVDNKALADGGSFVVSEFNLEEQSLVADHALMNTLAVQSGGQMATPSQLDSIPHWLARRDDIKTIVHTRNVATPIFNLWWILALIVILLTVEWVARKYYNEV